MKAWIKIFILSCILAVFSAVAFAQAPQTMNYQGRLADDAGNAITSTVNDVVFTIYDAVTEGNPLWTETDTLECDDNGVFMIELGREVPIDPMVFNGEKRWLGIKVGADDEMVPRQLLSSVPYSFNTMGPGVAYKQYPPANSFNDLTASTHSVDSIKIDIPGPGYVHVSATATYAINHTNPTTSSIYYQIRNVENSIIYDYYGVGLIRLPSVLPTGTYWLPTSCDKIFTEDTPGTKTYYYNVIVSAGYDTGDDIFDLNLTAIYYPSGYGAVSQKRVPLKSLTGQNDEMNPGGITQE